MEKLAFTWGISVEDSWGKSLSIWVKVIEVSSLVQKKVTKQNHQRSGSFLCMHIPLVIAQQDPNPQWFCLNCFEVWSLLSESSTRFWYESRIQDLLILSEPSIYRWGVGGSDFSQTTVFHLNFCWHPSGGFGQHRNFKQSKMGKYSLPTSLNS